MGSGSLRVKMTKLRSKKTTEAKVAAEARRSSNRGNRSSRSSRGRSSISQRSPSNSIIITTQQSRTHESNTHSSRSCTRNNPRSLFKSHPRSKFRINGACTRQKPRPRRSPFSILLTTKPSLNLNLNLAQSKPRDQNSGRLRQIPQSSSKIPRSTHLEETS